MCCGESVGYLANNKALNVKRWSEGSIEGAIVLVDTEPGELSAMMTMIWKDIHALSLPSPWASVSPWISNYLGMCSQNKRARRCEIQRHCNSESTE